LEAIGCQIPKKQFGEDLRKSREVQGVHESIIITKNEIKERLFIHERKNFAWAQTGKKFNEPIVKLVPGTANEFQTYRVKPVGTVSYLGRNTL
jgi:hypothetical protein